MAPKLHTTHPGSADAEKRRYRALDLRTKAWSFRDIAAELGVSLKTAHADVVDALAELRETKLDKAEELRDLELQKLDAIESEMRKRLEGADDQDAAKISSVIIKTMESRRRLIGLDAPQKIEHSGNLYTIKDASPECAEWGLPTGESPAPNANVSNESVGDRPKEV